MILSKRSFSPLTTEISDSVEENKLPTEYENGELFFDAMNYNS